MFLTAYGVGSRAVFLKKAGALHAVDAVAAADMVHSFFHSPHFLLPLIFKQAHLFKRILLDL